MQVNPFKRPLFLPILPLLLAALLLAVHIPAGQALEPGQVSYAAAITAGLRAVAAMHPDEKVRNPDYLAAKLLPPNFWLFGVLHKDYARSMQFIKAYRVGGFYTINAATMHIDGLLRKNAKNGLQQVVLVGAGFDSRAYRLGGEMPGVRFFEIDLPDTSAPKRKAVAAEFGTLPDNVTYIPFEYRQRSFIGALKKAGFDEKAKTLFIWDYTAVFMEAKVIDLALRYIAQRTNSENKVVMSYIPAEFVRGEYGKMGFIRFRELRSRASGEPWKFGIPRNKTAAFFNRRGFKVIDDLGARELAGEYLIRSDGKPDGKPSPYTRIVYAGVAR